MSEILGRLLVRFYNFLFIILIIVFVLYYVYGKGEVFSILRECVGILRVGDVVTYILFDSGVIYCFVSLELVEIGGFRKELNIDYGMVRAVGG